jgi:FkbM family methyltransferase
MPSELLHNLMHGFQPQTAPDKIRLGDRDYFIDRQLGNPLSDYAGHECWLDDVYEAALKSKRGAFLDVGANLGQTMFKILRIDPARCYVGFEPQLAPCFFLEQFILRNKLRSYSTFPLALSNTCGVVNLQGRGGKSGYLLSSAASLIAGFRPAGFYDYTHPVCTVRGDDVVPPLNLAAIAVIKIDVEGAELEVLEGLAGTIDRCAPILIFEVLHHFLAMTSEALDAETIAFREKRLQSVESFLRSRHYVIHQILTGREIQTISAIRPQQESSISTTDYVAVPERENEAFIRLMRNSRRVSAST